MKLLLPVLSSAMLSALLLSACGQAPLATSETKDVADCHSLFAGHIQLSVGSYSGQLTVYPRGNGIGIASIDAGEGLEAACGRSDVDGFVSYSLIPFTADYTMTLDLTSASCGNRRIVVSGDCQASGYATAELDGSEGMLTRVP